MGQDITSLLSLPIETLAVLGGGYVAYRIAYVGRKAGHSATDTIMISLFFGLLLKWLLGLLQSAEIDVAPSIALSVMVTWIIAAFWRAWLDDKVRAGLSWAKVSHHDGQPDVFSSLIARGNLEGPTRIIVKLDDGTNLMSDNLAQFDKSPLGATLIGEDGSIALYVTDICKPGEKEWVAQDPICESYGHLMTFIPASRIRLVEIQRHK